MTEDAEALGLMGDSAHLSLRWGSTPQPGEAVGPWVTRSLAIYKPSLLWTCGFLERWTRAGCDLMEIVVCLGRNEQWDRFKVSKVEFRPVGCFMADGVS